MPDTKGSLRKLKKPKRRYPDTVLVDRGRPASAIVCPDDASYRELAAELAAAIRELSGPDVPLVSDADATTPPDRNLILLGKREHEPRGLPSLWIQLYACG